jgi:hypothetical protein
VDKPGTHTCNFIGADGCAHTTATECYSAINCACGNGTGQWDNVVRVVIAGARLERTEVDDLIGSITQQLRDLLFQNEPSMV